jgi:VWFA-related protein
VAVFTSEKMLLDFTSDKGRIQEALAQLQPSARSRHRGTGQLSADSAISDYQALEMLQTEDCSHDNAWLVATAPTGGCNPGMPLDGRTPNQPSNVHIQELKMKARAVAEESAVQARGNLQQLEAVTKYLAQAPGLRTVILVSSGFLSQSEQAQLDRITEEAVRSQVVINSLDPKGLAVGMREADATRNTFSADPHVNSAMHQMDAAREFAAADVMAEFAQGTGGEFIHNENDLKAGFARLAGQPAHYVLAFTPRDLKPDGKYHELKVTLADKQRGFSIQARRGYFAPSKKSDVPMDVAAGNKQPEPIAIEPKQPAAEAHANAKPVSPAINLLEEKTRAALNSQEEAAALPIGIEVSPTGGSTGGEAGLSVLTHLDIKPMHLRKDAGQNIDTITFTVGVFDPAGTLVSAKQRSVKLNATDEQLAGLKENGVEITTSFPLKPGSYRVRAVVAESEEQKVAATSRDAVVQ